MQSRSKLALTTTLVSAFAIVSGCASDKPAPATSTPQQASTAASSSSGAKPSSAASAAQPAINSAAMTKPSAQSVFFDYDSFSVKNQYANDVRANTEYMMKANVNVELGGNADERGSHTPDQYAEWAAVAQRFGLAASRGSDFHGPGESRHDLGSLPPLPKSLTPVWHDWPEAAALERR